MCFDGVICLHDNSIIFLSYNIGNTNEKRLWKQKEKEI